MFIGAEVRLDIGFNAAHVRLANLARGGLLRRASDDAYRQLGTRLTRAGPLGAAPGMSGLVHVRFSDIAVHEDFAVAAMRWEATGPTGTLLPALDADINLTPAGQEVAVLTVSGSYRPPLGTVGAALDRAIMHRVAQATIQSFTQHIGTAIARPAAAPEAAYARTLPEPPPWPEPETPEARWAGPALTDIHHQGFAPGRMSDHGEHGEEAPQAPFVHAGLQGRDRGGVPARGPVGGPGRP